MPTCLTAEEIHDKLFTDVNGYALSASGRDKRQEYNNSDFTYGEVTPQSMQSIISMLPSSKGVFCDLGSGTGKAVVLAPIIGDFERSIGVELVADLHDAALHVGSRFDSEVRPLLPETKRHCELEFRNDDILATDVSTTDVVLAHCTTCFSEEMMSKFTWKCSEVRPGTLLACVSRRLEMECFEQLKVESCTMGWGTATVYLYVRK